jgi:beta-xylosidase
VTATATLEATAAVSPTLPATPVVSPTLALIPGETFQNPVIRTNFPDPSILPVGDTFYAFATNGSGRNVQAARSQDLVNWEGLGDAMPGLASWIKISRSDVWAPEAIQVGDAFVLYYTARDDQTGRQCIGAAVSELPEGKYSDPRDQALVCQTQEGGSIDPSPFRDGEKLYLFWKNDGNCCGYPTYLYVQELAADGLSLVGEPVRLESNDEVWEGSVVEAPSMVKHADRYYLFFSGNSFDNPNYAVGYAICESVTGPCNDAEENPILKSYLRPPPVIGPGHQYVLQVGDETWIFYHAWEVTSLGVKTDRRLVWLDQIAWENGEPDVLGPTVSPQPVPLGD